MVSRSYKRLCGGVVAAILVGSVAMAAPAQAGAAPGDPAKKLTKAVTLPGVLRHLTALQRIADANGDTRASGTPGYDHSVDYVSRLLRKAGYRVSTQAFEFNYCDAESSSLAQTAPTPTEYVEGTDYDLMTCSGSGDVTAEVVPVELDLTEPREPVTSGCEATDFDAVDVTGKIALLQRGTCTFGIKAANAEAAGAVGVIVMNQGNGDPVANIDRYDLLAGTLGAPVGIPAVGVSYATGEAFANTPGLIVHLSAETTAEVRETENIIADSRWGSADHVVMAGAHLDSVPEGPGINDNGTGAASILEVALRAAKTKTKNKLRFAWWGAEEASLVGSTYYVANLPAEQLAQISVYLNFDMVGSPNYVFGVYDGDDSAAEGSGPGPAGSTEIEALFEDFFASRGLSTVPADFTGRSDYGPFIAAGVDIPSGGLFTGAEGLKTEEEAAEFGGVAGAQYDPCYHEPCDSLTPVPDGADAELYRELRSEYRLFGNVNTFALDVNADAIATAVLTYAYDLSSIPPRTPAAAASTTATSSTATSSVPATDHGDHLR